MLAQISNQAVLWGIAHPACRIYRADTGEEVAKLILSDPGPATLDLFPCT